MNSQNNSQSEKRFLQFLKEFATDCGFYGDIRQVFITRFDPSNLGLNNKNLVNKIEWNNPPDDCQDLEKETQKILFQRFQDHLGSIIKELEKKGCFIKRKGSGRPKKGETPWEQAYKCLREKFIQWKAEQDCNAASELDNRLPKKFKVYVNGKNIISHYEPGYEEKVLPTINKYYKKGESGGYIACYSHNPKDSVCCVDDGIYLIGQIWMEGEYKGRIFVPKGYEGIDISADAQLKQACNVEFHQGGEDCWPGGDTGGWFEDAKGRIASG